MKSWIITIPRTVDWEDFQKELDAVKDGDVIKNYKIGLRPNELKSGDRIYITYKDIVRGWIKCVGCEYKRDFECETTGIGWSAGNYLGLSGPFHEIEGHKVEGFRGIKEYVAPGPLTLTA